MMSMWHEPSHHMHCSAYIGARCSTHCDTGDEIHMFSIYLKTSKCGHVFNSLLTPSRSELNCSQGSFNGAFFSCVYRGHELRPCFNNYCTTCAHNSGLVQFELARLTLNVMQQHSRDYYSLSSLGLHQYYMSQHGKVQLRNGTIVSLRMCAFCYARYDKNTHDSCPREHNIFSTHDLHHMNEMHH